jgi:hypothetical protein
MTDKFIGYLVSVECKNLFYQGIVASIDSTKAIIQLKNCFQNGIHCGAKLIEIKYNFSFIFFALKLILNEMLHLRTKEIENIEILADPQNALNFLNPKLINDVSNNGNSSNENSEPKQIINDNNKVNSNNENNSNNNLRIMTKNQQPLKVNSSKNNVSPMSGSPPINNNGTNSNNSQYNENNSKRKQSYNGNVYTNGHDSYHQNIENCFTSVNVETIKEDFDFEQNLALFDKDAFYEQMEGHSKPACSNYSEEPLNAYDSLIKQLNSNGNNSNGNNNSHHTNGNVDMNKSAQLSNQRSTTERYHQISVANLFSSTATKVCI